MKNEKVRAHVFVSGLVQGVFFRDSTQKKAQTLGVFGWVKNLADGQVEAVFEGEKDAVLDLIEWSKRGPDSARVDSVEVKWEKYKGEFGSFTIRY